MPTEIALSVPITLITTALLAMLNLGISIYVGMRRGKTKVSLGDGGNEVMMQATRMHGNFAEYVPIPLIMMLAIEVSSGPAWLLHVIGDTLLLGRLLHAYGLHSAAGQTMGRGFGMLLTYISYLFAIGGCFYLAFR